MYTSATRWSLASPVTFATVPSTTRSRPSLLVAITQCASCARFVALREVGLATKCNASSTHTANNGARCGNPSWRTVASQYVSASARRSRASAHGVGVVSPARYGCSAAGAFSAIAYLLQLCRSPYVLVEPEEVCGVVATLDLNEPLPGRVRVGRADSRFALVAEEVDVHARVALLQRPPRRHCQARPPRLGSLLRSSGAGVARLELYTLEDDRRPLGVEDATLTLPVPISIPSRYGPSAVDPDFISAIARIYADLQAGSFAVSLPGFLEPSDRDTMRDDRLPVYAAGGEQGQRASHRERVGVGTTDGQLASEDVVGPYGDLGLWWSHPHPHDRPARFGGLHRGPHRLGATDALERPVRHAFRQRLRLHGHGADLADAVPPAGIRLADEYLRRARRYEKRGAQNPYRAGAEDQGAFPRT